ncbi:YjeO family protein [Salmonella enterica]|uniref:YjeO family protein n=1 Tax=Salmonella enterica TaxID=28901 RepID=UPI0021D48F5C|nr:YjeO family protein [Salmonella enterica]MCU7098664.1 YjeO family protein [Salmonella enterica]MCU7116046.1 YjeO family protein [Salmonella enterica]
MSPKMFALCAIWILLAIPLIAVFSVLDKEWMIGESGINNICDVMRTVENDDSRGFGAMVTLPLFFPFFYVTVYKKIRSWFLYCVALVIFAYWSWQFFLRYQFCV